VTSRNVSKHMIIENENINPYVSSGDVKWYIWNAWPDKCSSGTPTISSCCLGSL